MLATSIEWKYTRDIRKRNINKKYETINCTESHYMNKKSLVY